MQTVGQLDKDHPDVVGHRQQHLPKILGLFLLIRPERDLTDLRHPFHEVRDLIPEMRLQLFLGRHGIFQRIVEKPGDDGRHVQLEEGQNTGHGQRVLQVGLAGPASLPLMRPRGELIRAPEQGLIRVRITTLHLPDQIIDLYDTGQ